MLLRFLGRKRSLDILAKLTGTFDTDDQYVYAVCDQIPHLISYGADEEAALDSLQGVMSSYLGALARRGEIFQALEQYGVEYEVLSPQLPITWAHGIGMATSTPPGFEAGTLVRTEERQLVR